MENCPICRTHSRRPMTITSTASAIPPDIAIRMECRVRWCLRFRSKSSQDGNYVVLLSETEHSVRIIPLDGRPHLKNYRAWAGDSRGRWEGDTLVSGCDRL